MTLDDWIRIAPLLSAGAIIGSAAVALGVFIYTRRINRRRATLDMIMRTFLDEQGRKRYEEFKAIIRRDQDPDDAFDIASLAVWSVENQAEFSVVKNQLNDYELVALGIRKGLFGERFYKRWFHAQFIKDMGQVKRLLDALQAIRPTHFCEATQLYHNWKKNQHPDAQPNRFKMALWVILGDYVKLDRARVSMRAAKEPPPS